MNEIDLKKRIIIASIKATDLDVAHASESVLDELASSILAGLTSFDLSKLYRGKDAIEGYGSLHGYDPLYGYDPLHGHSGRP